jgi:DNA-directed RNA polymerase subunit RPC12/RpoP
VTSVSAKKEDCLSFRDQFQSQLSGTEIEFVDYQPAINRIPVVIPYEFRMPWPVEIRNRKLTIQPPVPRLSEDIGSSEAWFVDLCKDLRTGRAVGGAQLPPTPVASDVLNGPSPPTFSMQVIPQFGDGTDCINIYCSGRRREVVNLCLPTGEEILGEILLDFGVTPLPDEKRSSYLPVIKRFGGIFPAAAAFSGQRGKILTILAESTKTISELQGACHLGRGEIEGQSFDQWIKPVLQSQSDRMKRIATQRFREHNRRTAPENLRPQILLEHWADRNILTRQWKIGPCGRCNQTYFVPSLNIQRQVVCTNCGHRISLPPKVPIGYTLQRAVRHAIKEGIIPVALTGRFLHNMTDCGFFWLPGIKYRVETKQGDIDILACCDGLLVFCECKNLANSPPEKIVWGDIVAQFLDTAAIAQKCGGNLVVLAALVEGYPETVQEQIKGTLGTSIPYLLLTRSDLEEGHRDVPFHETKKWLDFSDLIPPIYPYREHEKTDKPRIINMGWGTYTRQ